jgi:phosphoglycolate phosphatase
MGAVAVGGVKAAELDGVTLDAYGTLLTLVDPMPELLALLPGHEPRAIEHAFHAEAAYYRGNIGEGRDAATLARLRESCVGVFNDALGSSLSVEEYVGALRFEVLPGTVEALERLRALGLTLAVVGNWDFSLHERLADAGLTRFFPTVVHAAGKPDPAGILRALDSIGVSRGRALHIGDGDSDEQAARAAGVRFEPAPLPDAVEALT